jgi:hypothetical protein
MHVAVFQLQIHFCNYELIETGVPNLLSQLKYQLFYPESDATQSSVNVHVLQTRGYKNCTLLGYYAASSGNKLPTFRNNLSVPSSGLKNPLFKFHESRFLNPKDGTSRLTRNVGKKLHVEVLAA